jgi:hypothetical protein
LNAGTGNRGRPCSRREFAAAGLYDRFLWAEASVHVPEGVVRQSGGGVTQEGFSLVYEVSFALEGSGADVAAAEGGGLGSASGDSGWGFQGFG